MLIVHYGNPVTTRQAVAAITAAEAAPENVWIIDHGPHPYPEPPSQEKSSLRVIRPNHNAGYAGGLNFGLGVLLRSGIEKDDIVICMNNDLTVTPDAFMALRQHMNNHPEPALVGAATERDGKIHAGRGEVNLTTGRADVSKVFSPSGEGEIKRGWIFRNSLPLRRGGDQEGVDIPRLTRLPYLHGAFIAAPYHVWLRLRGWPEDKFLYWEDVHLSRIAQQRAVALQTINQVLAHHAPAAPQQNDNEIYYLVRNGAAFLEKKLSLPWRWYWQIRNRLRRVYHALKPGANPTVRQALHDAAAGVTGPRQKGTSNS